MFEPPQDVEENLHFFNIKRAFKKVSIAVETYQAK